MSKLPNPIDVRERIKSSKSAFRNRTSSFNVAETWYYSKKALLKLKSKYPSGQSPVDEQFSKLIHPTLTGTKVSDIRMGWSEKYSSITFALIDSESNVQTYLIRTATDREGKPVKWKTYGNKTFTPSKINPDDDIVYIASGIGEYLLFELMGVSYIAPQSDSIVRGITQQMIDAAEGKILIYLQDNDESGKKLGERLKIIFDKSIFLTIDFECVMDRDLPIGYDFRDFANWIAERYEEKAWEVIEQMVTREIKIYAQIMKMLKSLKEIVDE